MARPGEETEIETLTTGSPQRLSPLEPGSKISIKNIFYNWKFFKRSKNRKSMPNFCIEIEERCRLEYERRVASEFDDRLGRIGSGCSIRSSRSYRWRWRLGRFRRVVHVFIRIGHWRDGLLFFVSDLHMAAHVLVDITPNRSTYNGEISLKSLDFPGVMALSPMNLRQQRLITVT